MNCKKLIILFSGEGSNLQSIVEALHHKTFGGTSIEVVLAFSNNPDAYGIVRCHTMGIPCAIEDHRAYSSRELFDAMLIDYFRFFAPDLIVLAGFMRILSPVFTDSMKALNIHPSLLPLFKGENAMRASYESDMKVAGVTVHCVSDTLDSGKIVAQKCLDKIEDECFESFKVRMHALEHELYPKAILKTLGLPVHTCNSIE
jgi:phosphoribosylglycinamide formyltransferase 1